MIWRSYLYKEIFKVFCLVFFSLFLLAILIDFSAHMKVFWQTDKELILGYYLAQLSRQGELFTSVALLLANIKVLTTLNMRGEITALWASGVSLRRIVSPLLTIGVLFTLLLFFNEEFLQPKALSHLTKFEEKFFKSTESHEIASLTLQDQSRLLYQRFDPEKKRFFDLFWIKDSDHIFRIEELSPYEKRGYQVDVLEKEEKKIVWKASYDVLDFPEMAFEGRSLFQATLPAEWQKLSQLFFNLPPRFLLRRQFRDDEAKIITFFFQRLTAPLLALFVSVAPISFCLCFERKRRLFLLYSLSLALLLTYFVGISTAGILGKNHILSPFWVVITPPFFATIFCGFRYSRLDSK